MALPTGLSNALLIPVCGGRPVLRRQEGEISQRPASAAVVVAVVDRRRQEASLQAEEVAEAQVVRPAVPHQVVGAAPAVAV